MADVGNLLAQFGNRPGILQQVDEMKAQQTMNRLREMQMVQEQDAMQRDAVSRDAYANALGGDESAVQTLARSNPELHGQFVKNLSAMQEEQRAALDEQMTGFAAQLMSAGGDPERLKLLGLTPEQVPDAMNRLMVYKTARELVMKQSTPSNFHTDDAGVTRAYYPSAGAMQEVPGGRSYVNPSKGSTAVINQMPGGSRLSDVPKFYKDVQDVVKPQADMVRATDNVIDALDHSINTGDFTAANAARQQLAQAIGDGNTNAAELRAIGVDPFLWGVVDTAVRAATGTPTESTLKDMRRAAVLLRNSAAKAGKNQIDQMKSTAQISGDYNPEDLNTALDLGVFKPRMRTVVLYGGTPKEKTVLVPEE